LPAAAGKGASGSRLEGRTRGQRFPRSRRLTSRRQYRKIYSTGRRAGASSLTLFGLPNDLDHSRVGLTVSRKVGGAVVRNRVKRKLREIFRRRCQALAPSLDLVVHARPEIARRDAKQLERELLTCIDHIRRRKRR
jgi:ribonuclease P protein component